MQLDGPQADELLRMSGPQGTREEFALLRMAPHPVLRRLAQPGIPGRYGRLGAAPDLAQRTQAECSRATEATHPEASELSAKSNSVARCGGARRQLRVDLVIPRPRDRSWGTEAKPDARARPVPAGRQHTIRNRSQEILSVEPSS